MSRVEIYKFPLADPPSQFNGLATDDENMIADVRLELEDQDAKPVREPEPTAKQIEDGDVPQSSSASPVCNPGWLGFLRHADKQEGWYEFADAHVNVKDFSENFLPHHLANSRQRNTHSVPHATRLIGFGIYWRPT